MTNGHFQPIACSMRGTLKYTTVMPTERPTENQPTPEFAFSAGSIERISGMPEL